MLVMSPLFLLILWGTERCRLFGLYYFIPNMLFGFFYSVYLVQRFGGTPGKRLMKIRITKVSGGMVTYREALLRYLPEWLMSMGYSVALIIPALHLTDAQYFAPPSIVERTQLLLSTTPSWYKLMQLASNIWIWSEFIVMLTNKERRAIHDFIAGTVVIKDAHPNVSRGAPQTARRTPEPSVNGSRRCGQF